MPSDSTTLGDLVIRRARQRGTHALLVCDADRLDYLEAEARSALVARGLIALGAAKGTHVGLLLPNGSEFVIAMLAAARLGAVVVPFATFATARELGEQLADSDVAILVATPTHRRHDYVARCREVLGVETFDVGQPLFSTAAPQLRRVAFGTEVLARLADTVDGALLSAMEDDVDACDPLTIVYTSGSTGAPKGAVHTHGSLLSHQANLNAIRGLSEDDRLFCNSPFFWIGGFAFGLLATIVAGSTLVCSNATVAADTLDLLEAERPTITNGFAAAIAHLARDETFAGRELSSMRRGNLYPIMPADTRPSDPELRHDMLGMTEAGSTLLLSGDDTDQPEERRGSYGRPAPGFEIEVVDHEALIPVQAGSPGELRIRGPHVMQRYHRRSREESFDADGWFATGDRVCVDLDGFVYFLGRIGSMIKTAGANVTPSEVERAISTVTGGAASHVVGIPDRQRGEIVAAVVVTTAGVQLDVDALRTSLANELSAYKVPRRIVAVRAEDLPLLSSGKVDVGGLRGLFDA